MNKFVLFISIIAIMAGMSSCTVSKGNHTRRNIVSRTKNVPSQNTNLPNMQFDKLSRLVSVLKQKSGRTDYADFNTWTETIPGVGNITINFDYRIKNDVIKIGDISIRLNDSTVSNSSVPPVIVVGRNGFIKATGITYFKIEDFRTSQEVILNIFKYYGFYGGR